MVFITLNPNPTSLNFRKVGCLTKRNKEDLGGQSYSIK